jgi:hypothetical protein
MSALRPYADAGAEVHVAPIPRSAAFVVSLSNHEGVARRGSYHPAVAATTGVATFGTTAGTANRSYSSEPVTVTDTLSPGLMPSALCDDHRAVDLRSIPLRAGDGAALLGLARRRPAHRWCGRPSWLELLGGHISCATSISRSKRSRLHLVGDDAFELVGRRAGHRLVFEAADRGRSRLPRSSRAGTRNLPRSRRGSRR